MTRRELLRVAALYVAALVAATIVWIALFHTPLLAGTVFFYRGLVLLVLTAVLQTLVVAAVGRTTAYRGLIGVRDVALILSVLLGVNVVLFTHLPVTADRSISVFILAQVDRAEGPLTTSEIADDFVQIYVVERGAIEKRLEEQLVTGTLVRSVDGYRITDEGRRLVDLYEVIATLFAVDKANLSR